MVTHTTWKDSGSRIMEPAQENGEEFQTMQGETSLQQILAALLGDKKPATAELEEAVARLWSRGDFFTHCDPALGLAEIAQEARRSAPSTGYGAGSDVEFRSWLLFGDENSPTGILVDAPPERLNSRFLQTKNRAPHVHQCGRITLITRGNATFLARRNVDGEDYVIEVPMRENDAVCWPGGVPHTFDAGTGGFSLLTLIPSYEDPGSDGFSRFDSELGTDLDGLPRMSFDEVGNRLGTSRFGCRWCQPQSGSGG